MGAFQAREPRIDSARVPPYNYATSGRAPGGLLRRVMAKTRDRDLIIVESPAKTRTLSAFLGGKYDIKASMGHVRDLPKHRFGVNVEKDFAPAYQIIPERKTVIEGLK